MSWDQQEPEAFADGQVKGLSAVAVIQDQGRLALGQTVKFMNKEEKPIQLPHLSCPKLYRVQRIWSAL